MPDYSPAARERAMKLQDVLLKAMAGKMTWIEAADVLGLSARTLRRWRYKFRCHGFDGLQDRRRRSPSHRAVPERELTGWLRLYRTRYRGYNARHFYATLRRRHGCQRSYSLVLRALQGAGLVKKHRPRGRHFLRREPRARFGELLHLDGSRHQWLALRPGDYQCLVTVVDDATRQLLYARLVDGETSEAVLTALRAVIQREGLPQSLYTDRASWAAHTPKQGEPVDKTKLSQVGRALKRLGIEHILAYSPQARGRSERVNRTLQGRLVAELKVHDIRILERANRYLDQVFLPAHNDEFARPAREIESCFVPLGPVDLEQILCHEEDRVVGKDNVVQLDAVRLQIAKQPRRATCAGIPVLVRRHLDGTHTVWAGPRLLGRYSATGRALSRAVARIARTLAGPVGYCAGDGAGLDSLCLPPHRTLGALRSCRSPSPSPTLPARAASAPRSTSSPSSAMSWPPTAS